MHLLPLHVCGLPMSLVSMLQAGVMRSRIASRRVPAHVLGVLSPNVGVLPLAGMLSLCGGG